MVVKGSECCCSVELVMTDSDSGGDSVSSGIGGDSGSVDGGCWVVM